MTKRIVLLSDGTGNASSKVWRTNVWRTFESLDLSKSDQVAIYDDGVGTSAFKPLAILGGAFGWGLKRNVLDLYKFVCRNYHGQDTEIFGFGFSRGAFTIRVVVGLLLNQGLVTYSSESELGQKAKAAYRAYRREKYHSALRVEVIFRWIRDLLVGRKHDKANNQVVKSVRFLGLWDTVAAYGLPFDEMTQGINYWLWPLELPDRNLNPRVKRACHALALDDERTTFHPVLWNEAGEAQIADAGGILRCTCDERITQLWFPGMHANVGGGYPDDSLAHVPLYWIMVEAAKCGLRFKRPPWADPDSLVRAKSSGDIDGRMYDSRQGLGGYYRYGPRKLSELCRTRFSRTPADRVEIDLPKIHESAFKRIRNGAHLYAPFGLPAKYLIVAEGGTIISPSENPFENSEVALRRAEAQEIAWNIVWKRRIVYFATVAASLVLAIYPLAQSIPRSAESSTRFRLMSDAIRLVGAFLPDALSPWVNAYARTPGKFSVFVILISILIALSSRLQAKITYQMKNVFNASDKIEMSPTDRAIHRLRTHKLYRWCHYTLSRQAAPLFFALLFVYLGATLTSHLLFDIQDAWGLVCHESEQSRSLGQGESVTVTFSTKSLCTPTGILLEEQAQYRVRINRIDEWSDSSIKTEIGGFHLVDLDWRQFALLSLALPLKRTFIRPWFRVVGRIGSVGAEEIFFDPPPSNPQTSNLDATFRPRREGELFLYVNDAVLAVPGFWDYFYQNNHGSGEIRIDRR